MNCLFVTGTDTDAGKTVSAVALLQGLYQRGFRVLASKPIAAGAEATAQGLRNSDALLLQQAAGAQQPYDQVNPFCFAPPIAPHIAAEQVGKPLQAAPIADALQQLQQLSADWLVIEGAGGWLLPLNTEQTLADVIEQLQLPVVLVVGLKLGCLNHALLTVADIERRGLRLKGWVGNQLAAEPMPYQAENIALLKARIAAPCLGILPHRVDWQQGMVTYLDISQLLQD
ncbi:dethiobiotin synthase [Pseudidiomarina mangrovi]|uniref:dethiobiotin synthase n=1 Tax=Pseudidiomarina mangrovi TaxID=2487133 RepID=UPI000FCC97DA|nr:dethiobiotin synthase [Pseudidiomarina mangrovi]CAI8153444.1 MAG: ATP-dependent dethiobiotin synthetase BioD 1 [Pseudidiomarina mangrovi]